MTHSPPNPNGQGNFPNPSGEPPGPPTQSGMEGAVGGDMNPPNPAETPILQGGRRRITVRRVPVEEPEPRAASSAIPEQPTNQVPPIPVPIPNSLAGMSQNVQNPNANLVHSINSLIFRLQQMEARLIDVENRNGNFQPPPAAQNRSPVPEQDNAENFQR